MPSWDIFEQQPQEYRDAVLPPEVTARVAIEQASTFGWERYVGRSGRVIGMQTFGASAPLKALQTEFGFTVDNVVAAAHDQLGQEKSMKRLAVTLAAAGIAVTVVSAAPKFTSTWRSSEAGHGELRRKEDRRAGHLAGRLAAHVRGRSARPRADRARPAIGRDLSHRPKGGIAERRPGQGAGSRSEHRRGRGAQTGQQ